MPCGYSGLRLTLRIFLDSASQVPQFWTYGKDVPIVTGFVTGIPPLPLLDFLPRHLASVELGVCSRFWLLAGDQAAAASALPPRQAADSFIKQLDAVYGTESNPRPATDAFVDFMVGRLRAVLWL